MWATFIIDIWYFKEKNSKSAAATPQNLRTVKSIKLLVYLTRSAAGVASFQKKNFFKSGCFGIPNFPHEMAWRSHLINYITKKPDRNKKFSFPFFPLFFTSILTTSSWIALEPLCIDSKTILDCPSWFFWTYISSQIIIWPQWKNTCLGEKSRNIIFKTRCSSLYWNFWDTFLGHFYCVA